jgi:hypothetical protein
MIGCNVVGWVVGGCGLVGGEASKELHNCTIAPSHLCQRKDNFCARVIAMCNSITQITQLHKFAKTAPYCGRSAQMCRFFGRSAQMCRFSVSVRKYPSTAGKGGKSASILKRKVIFA